MKLCNKCNKEKELNRFYKKKSNKDGYRNTCKECELDGKKLSNKKYYEENKEVLNEKSIIIAKKWRKNNLDHTKIYSKKYCVENSDKIRKYRDEYYILNKDIIMYKKNKRKIERIKYDHIFKLKCNIRTSISNIIRNVCLVKRS